MFYITYKLWLKVKSERKDDKMKIVEAIKDVEKIKRMEALILNLATYKEYAFVKVGLNTGLRVSDILNLKWDDLEVNDNFIYIDLKEKKTNKTKRIKLNGELRQTLTDLRVLHPTDVWVFESEATNVKGHKAWTRQTPYDFLNKYGKLAGVKTRIGTHTLRKSFGYHNYTRGIDLSYLQKIFNHSSPKMTLDYIGITQEEIDEIYMSTNL